MNQISKAGLNHLRQWCVAVVTEQGKDFEFRNCAQQISEWKNDEWEAVTFDSSKSLFEDSVVLGKVAKCDQNSNCSPAKTDSY